MTALQTLKDRGPPIAACLGVALCVAVLLDPHAWATFWADILR